MAADAWRPWIQCIVDFPRNRNKQSKKEAKKKKKQKLNKETKKIKGRCWKPSKTVTGSSFFFAFLLIIDWLIYIDLDQ